MNFKKIGLLLILATCCSVFYFYKKGNSTGEGKEYSFFNEKENARLTNFAVKDEITSCNCSDTHLCISSNASNTVQVNYKSSNEVPLASKKRLKKEIKTFTVSKKRPNRRQAFVSSDLSGKENTKKGKAILVSSKIVNTSKKVVHRARENRKSAFPYINVMICNSPGSEKYHEKMCRGIKKCATSIDTMKAFEAQRKDFEPCKICFKNLKNG